MSSVKIMDFGNGAILSADAGGIRISNYSVSQRESRRAGTPAADQLFSSLPSLLSEGIFSEEDNSEYYMALDRAIDLESREFDPLASLIEWSPFSLRIEAKGSLGFDDFKFIPRFFLGKRVVQLRTIGLIAWRSNSLFRLPAAHAIALELIAEFNSRKGNDKGKVQALDCLFQLQELAGTNSDIAFDPYLSSEKVVKPEKVSLGIQDDGKMAIVYPIFEGVPEEELKKQFLNISDVQDEYDIDFGDGKQRKRLILSPQLKSVLKNIKKNGFGLSGKARSNFYRNPRSIVPDGEDQYPDLMDIVGFGPRVKGIGFPTFVRPIVSTSKEDWFNKEGQENQSKSSTGESQGKIAIECGFIDGEIQKVEFSNDQEAAEFLLELKSTIAKGENSVTWKDLDLPITSQLIEGLESALAERSNTSSAKNNSPKEKLERKRLLIHTNEDVVEYAEESSSLTSSFDLKIPQSLKAHVKLKIHQNHGIQWLEGLLARDLAKGALLADDMGLGKTLQALTFLAWCIESEFKNNLGQDIGPYDPILIVAPLILLDNWKKEIDEYFDEGAFTPIEILHGQNLKKYRKNNSKGRETDHSIEALDIEAIRSNRLVITNYDTVKNYQYTFAKIPWSIVVVDEAQELKEPSTATTYALKALNPMFRIASTGTPVETSLTNLWSIMDFAHPGNGLGSLKAFNKEYGSLSFDDSTLGSRLRAALGFNTDSGLVLRRAKKDVLKDLPPKSIVERHCVMDESLIEKYQSIIQGVGRSEKNQMDALQALHSLSAISQHPFLLEGQPHREDWKDYLTASSKLRELVSILHEIKKKGEKALVFTRSRVMQDILKRVIDIEFGLDISIINGDTASKHQYVNKSRVGILSKFSASGGFNVLVLSPEVAGVGLTIVAANHVIHYGRWWNPAKENQATDRAYRIGQTLPVFVYHLLLKHPTGLFETFDEKLHRLLHAREELADNFLAPSGDESFVKDDLVGDLFGKKRQNEIEKKGTEKISIDRLSPYEFESFSALILRSRFVRSFVTSKAGDRGVDVIGVNKGEVLLIQCKKNKKENFCDSESISEIVDGADYYREFVFPTFLKQLPIRLAIVTSGQVDRSFLKDAKAKGIEVIDGTQLEQIHLANPVSQAEITTLEASRTKSVEILAKQLVSIYGK